MSASLSLHVLSTRAARTVLKRGLCLTPQVQATFLALYSQQQRICTSSSCVSSHAARPTIRAASSIPHGHRCTHTATLGMVRRGRFTSGASLGCGVGCAGTAAVTMSSHAYHHGALGRPSRVLRCQSKGGNGNNQLQGVNSIERHRGEEEERKEEEQEDPFARNSGPGYLPFPPPFHTINIIMLLLIANVLCYFTMMWGSDSVRDFVVENFTLSYDNAHRIYPLFTNALYQENLLQLLIDSWLLWQFGDTMLGFLGNARLTFFVMLCTLGSSFIHLARQKFELHYGMDELEVRGRCYGPNPFIMGLIAIEGLIFRHLNFIQQPPIPFLVLTAFVMVLDVWRIFTTQPEEHGAATGGALMAYLFWALPTRFLGLDKLTATM